MREQSALKGQIQVNYQRMNLNASGQKHMLRNLLSYYNYDEVLTVV